MTLLLLQSSGFPTVGVQQGFQEAFQAVKAFIVSDSMVAAQVVFGTILVIHVLIGAAELVVGQASRFLSGTFWIRIVFVGLITFGFTEIFMAFGESLSANAFSRVVDAYCTLWNQVLDLTKKNTVDTLAELCSGPGWVWITMSIAAIVELVLSLCSFVISSTIALLLLLYVWFQALVGLGTALLTLAMGPVCLPFAANEATQDIAIGYAKSFIVNVVLYLPLLSLGFEIALHFMAAQTAFSLGANFTNMDNFGNYIVGIVLVPLGAVAIVQSVPNIIRGALR